MFCSYVLLFHLKYGIFVSSLRVVNIHKMDMLSIDIKKHKGKVVSVLN
jgi:hypothetical protein